MKPTIYHYPRRKDCKHAALIITIYTLSALVSGAIGGILYTILRK